MKAVIQKKYGSPEVLKYTELPVPEPKENEVLIKLEATSINYGNNAMLQGKPFPVRLMIGFSKPRNPIPGGDLAGTIVSTGKDCTLFKEGDRVYGDITDSAGGTFAEYTTATEDTLCLMPSNITFAQAAAAPVSAMTALKGLRDVGQLKEGQSVLIPGASGSVGLFAVQIAKAIGAKVTGVCRTDMVDLVLSAGADRVIDYKKQDYTQLPETYDLIFDLAGNKGWRVNKKRLNKNGIYVPCAFVPMAMLFGSLANIFSSRKTYSFFSKVRQQDLKDLKDLFEAGKLTSFIGNKYTLEQAAEAFKSYEEKTSKGKIVLTI